MTGEIVVTFKGGADKDAPRITIHATSIDDAINKIGTLPETLAGRIA